MTILRSSHLPLALACLVLTATPAWCATTWTTDAAASKLTFVATQAGGEFEGRFNRFTPAITFDPADLPHSRFSVTIDATSAETGEAERDKTLKGKDFFAVQQWPAARFETLAFRATGGGAFEATGRLTLRNVTREVRLPFSFKPAADGRTATLSGGTTVQRLDFGVGQGEWQDTQWVGNPVRIHFELLLRKATP
jgi:polyisoprenoid-binding protein YceI